MARRILLVSHRYLPRHSAGVENYTREIARGLHQNGWEVAVATTAKVISRTMGHLQTTSVDGLLVYEVVNHHAMTTFRETYDQPAMVPAFQRILAEFRPSVVHIQHLMYWSLDLADLARESGAVTVLTLHDFWTICARMGQLIDRDGTSCAGPEPERCAICRGTEPFGQGEQEKAWIRRLIGIRTWTGIPLDRPLREVKRLLSRRLNSSPQRSIPEQLFAEATAFKSRQESFFRALQSFHTLITPSRTVASQIRSVFGGRVLPRVIRQGRDHRLYAAACQTVPATPLKVVFIGQIAPHKGVHVLIEAVCSLPHERVHLSVYGPGEHNPEYLASCRLKARGASNITFGGSVPSTRVPEIFAGADVFCLPSLWSECWPLSIQEAFLARRPVLVSAIGAMMEAVRHEVDGLHVEAGNAVAWASALARLIDEPGLYARLAEQIPDVPSLEDHIHELAEVYGQNLDGGS